MANILLVDDDERLLELGKEFMEEEGRHTVITACSVNHALQHIGIDPIDVIVSDYQMPEIDGIEFLSTIRGRKDRIPFILFTGKGREEIVIEAINRGADYYIKKDTDVRAQYAQLLHTIDQALMRKDAENAVEHNLNMFKQLIENSSDIIVVANDIGRIEYASPSIKRVLGYNENDIIGHQGIEFIRPEVVDFISQYQVDNPDAFRSRWMNLELKRKDGTWAMVEIIANLFIRGGQKKIIINARDITERMQKDRQLEFLIKEFGIHQSDLQNISLQGLVGGVDFDFSTNKMRLTPAALKIFDLSDRNGELDISLILDIIHPDDLSIVRDEGEFVVQREEPLEMRFRIILPSGEIRHINSVTCTKMGKDNAPISIQGIIRDCTEMACLQEKMMTIGKKK